jgi:hypothetical protein
MRLGEAKILLRLFKKYRHFTEPKMSFPFLKDPTICSHPEPDKSSAFPTFYLFIYSLC